MDDLFRKGLKGMTEQEVDARLDEVVTIFRFLQDKDVTAGASFVSRQDASVSSPRARWRSVQSENWKTEKV